MDRPTFLKGKNIFLGPLSKNDDLEGYATWLNNQEITLYMGSGRFPVNYDALKDYISSFQNSKEGMLLGIFLTTNSKHIGNITLHQIDWLNKFAEVGIIIGDEESHGKGYAIEAIRLVVEHAFNKMNLRKVYAGMVHGNEASKKAFEAVGFQVEGTLRKHFYLNGKYLDCYRMGLLKSEYK
ncbi:MAG: GNAT family N-acetyltransferase [Desulfobacteraceae bacterium]|nr:GNAT family N-acetyltransferase [Desulfobacteraceae bacterium]